MVAVPEIFLARKLRDNVVGLNVIVWMIDIVIATQHNVIMATQVVLPGQDIPSDVLPTSSNSSLPLKLGPGLRHIPPSTITPTIAGSLCVDNRKNAVWVESNGGRVRISHPILEIFRAQLLKLPQYIPQTGDLVIATVHHSSTEVYHCSITPYTTFAQLPQLAFEGATKKTRPQLSGGSLIYARISLASKHLDPELECLNPSTGKADGMGELMGGMVFDISLGMARRLMMPRAGEQGGVVVLEELGEKLPFEVAVGRNGRIWIDSKGVRETLLVGRAVMETDQGFLAVEEQRKLVRHLLKSL